MAFSLLDTLCGLENFWISSCMILETVGKIGRTAIKQAPKIRAFKTTAGVAAIVRDDLTESGSSGNLKMSVAFRAASLSGDNDDNEDGLEDNVGSCQGDLMVLKDAK